MIVTSAFLTAYRYLGLKEIPGELSNPEILAMLQMDTSWPTDDDVPWCSAFANKVCQILGLPRSKSLRARYWLNVGTPIEIEDARPEDDIVILKRGGGDQPGADVLDAPGHVTFFAGMYGDNQFLGLGGNQSDMVRISLYPVARILGVRRLA